MYDYRIQSNDTNNPFSNNTFAYIVDGQRFESKGEAVRYVRNALDCSLSEAVKYIESLPNNTSQK